MGYQDVPTGSRFEAAAAALEHAVELRKSGRVAIREWLLVPTNPPAAGLTSFQRDLSAATGLRIANLDGCWNRRAYEEFRTRCRIPSAVELVDVSVKSSAADSAHVVVAFVGTAPDGNLEVSGAEYVVAKMENGWRVVKKVLSFGS